MSTSRALPAGDPTPTSHARPTPPARRDDGPSPRAAVRAEVWRALGAGVCLAPRLAAYAWSRTRARAELIDDLDHPCAIDRAPDVALPRDRPLHVFVSCAEVSGEVHALNAVRALRRLAFEQGAPTPRFTGLGGARSAEDGVEILGNPVERAQMGLGVWSSVPWYARLLERCASALRDERPDVLLIVDSPALHVPLARIAHRYGVPVVHFVTPQYWGWAPWRAASYARAVDRALSILPFEKPWFTRRGIAVAHVGHPLLDALRDVPTTVPRPDARSLVILPGSRSGVIERNLPWMLRVAARLRARCGDLPVVVAHEREDVARAIRVHLEREGASGWATLSTGDLHATLSEARAALSVSGTVLLDLLHHALPTVVVYRLSHGFEVALKDRLLTVPWFSSVNLLAGREVYPEFCFAGEGPVEAAGAALARLYVDGPEREECRTGLELAAARLGPAGACERAARATVDVAVNGPGAGRTGKERGS